VLNLFYLRPVLRNNMAFIEELYRMDTKDDEPLTSFDRFLLRRFVVGLARKDLLGGAQRVLH
jgi:hypothetical protein